MLGGLSATQAGQGYQGGTNSTDARGLQELEGARPLPELNAVKQREPDVVLDRAGPRDVAPVVVGHFARDLASGDLPLRSDADDVGAEKPNLLPSADVDEATLAATPTRVGRRGDRGPAPIRLQDRCVPVSFSFVSPPFARQCLAHRERNRLRLDLVDIALRGRQVGVAGEVADVNERDRRTVGEP